MTLRAAMVVAALATAVVAPAAVSPAADLGGVCARAAELTKGGHPQQALSLIAALRGTRTPPKKTTICSTRSSTSCVRNIAKKSRNCFGVKKLEIFM